MNARSGTWRRMSANLRRRRDIRAESFAYAVAVRYVKRHLAKPADAVRQNSICVATPTRINTRRTVDRRGPENGRRPLVRRRTASGTRSPPPRDRLEC